MKLKMIMRFAEHYISQITHHADCNGWGTLPRIVTSTAEKRRTPNVPLLSREFTSCDVKRSIMLCQTLRHLLAMSQSSELPTDRSEPPYML